MQLTYRPTNYADISDCELLAGWLANPEIWLRSRPHRKFEMPPPSAEQIQAEHILRQQSQPSSEEIDLLVLLEGKPIGGANIMWNPPHLLTREGKVAWASLMIGETNLHRRGFGSQIMRHLEELAREKKADHMELGVFAFNEPSLGLMKSLGYREIARVPDVTYWQGKPWDCARFLVDF